MSELNDLVELDNITLQQILNNLLSADKNLELKTQIDKPLQLSVLYTLADSLEQFDFEQESSLIKGWIKRYLTYMVSKDRLSRKEIIKAITSFNQSDKEGLTFAKKLITDMK